MLPGTRTTSMRRELGTDGVWVGGIIAICPLCPDVQAPGGARPFMGAGPGNAREERIGRAVRPLWLTGRTSMRTLKRVSIFMMPPYSQRYRRYADRVHIQCSRSIPSLHPRTGQILSGVGKLSCLTNIVPGLDR